MRYLLVLGLVALGGLFSPVRPVFAAGFLIWADIFRPFAWAKSGEPFAIAKVVVAAFAFSFCVGLARRRVDLKPNRAAICLMAFIAWCGVSAALAPNRSLALEGFATVVKLLTPILFISFVLPTLKDIEFLIWVLALSVGIYGAQAGLHAILVGHPVTDMAIDGGQMMDRNDFIVAVLASAPLLLFMARRYQGRFRKPLRACFWILFALSVVAVPLSNSRGGMLGLACTVVFTTWLTKRRWRNLALLALIVPILFALVPQAVWDRLNTIELSGHQEEGSAAERLQQMQGGLRMAGDNPVSGVGPYAFLEYIRNYTPAKLEAHSIYIKCAAELGIPGLLIYLASIGYVFAGLFAIYKRFFGKDSWISSLALCLCMSHLGFCTAAAFVNQLYSEYYWSLFVLSGAFIRVVNRKFPAGAPLAGPGPHARAPRRPVARRPRWEPGVTQAGEGPSEGASGPPLTDPGII